MLRTLLAGASALALATAPALADGLRPYPKAGTTVNTFAAGNDTRIVNALQQGAALTQFGTSLYPLYAAQLSASASFTATSNQVTGPAAIGSQIVVGDSISTSPYTVPFTSAGTSPTVQSVSITGGTATVTMTMPAAVSQTATISFGQNRFSSASTIFANTVAAGVGYFGEAAQGRTTWLNGTYGWNGIDNYSNAQLTTIATYGTVGGMFAGRTSDNATGNLLVFGIEALADRSSALPSNVNTTLWGGYIQADALASAAPYHNQLLAVEIDMHSQWNTAAIDPFTLNPGNTTETLRLAAFGANSDPLAKDASGPIHIVPNGAKFDKGIVFDQNALDGTNYGGKASAVAMAPNQSVDWFCGAGSICWRVYSQMTSGGSATGANALNLTSAGVGINANSGVIGFTGTNKALVVGDPSSAALGLAINGTGAVQLQSGSSYSILADTRSGSQIIYQSPTQTFKDGGSTARASISSSGFTAGSSAVSGVAATVQNSAASCTHTPTTSSETVTCSSDARLKRHIIEAHSALKWLMSFHIFEFDTKKDGSHHTGTIAQDVAKDHPELVHEMSRTCGDIASARPGCVTTLGVEQPDVWKVLEVEQELFRLIRDLWIALGLVGIGFVAVTLDHHRKLRRMA